jgi:hypothetical protein
MQHFAHYEIPAMYVYVVRSPEKDLGVDPCVTMLALDDFAYNENSVVKFGGPELYPRKPVEHVL